MQATGGASAAFDPDDDDDEEDIYGSIRKAVEDSGVGDVYSAVLNSKPSVLSAPVEDEDIYTPVRCRPLLGPKLIGTLFSARGEERTHCRLVCVLTRTHDECTAPFGR